VPNYASVPASFVNKGPSVVLPLLCGFWGCVASSCVVP